MGKVGTGGQGRSGMRNGGNTGFTAGQVGVSMTGGKSTQGKCETRNLLAL